ncbi:MAG: N-acetylmuramoyl-L-alanine amidase [Thermodesulfobacteriota bacterium]
MYNFRKLVSLLIVLCVIFLIASGIPAFAKSSAKDKGKEGAEAPDEETIKLIVIDPGHGGKDTGAIGPGGALEKDITLAIAVRLKDILLENTGAEVLLTREDDEFWPLSERTEFANKRKADIFISIHVNAARRRRAHGVETFFLSFDATDDEARETAAFENNVISLEGKTDSAPMEDIKSILWDLTQTEAHHESARLAESIYKSLYKAMGGEFRGVKQAPFHVLVGATMPAVLIEVGFISNPREEKKLLKEKVQTRMAEAISNGVVIFKRGTGKVAGSYTIKNNGGSERYGKD